MVVSCTQVLLLSACSSFRQILWIYPIYGLSFVLSTVWYQDIADHAYLVFRNGKRHEFVMSFSRWLSLMADELYRCLVVGAFSLQMTLCALVPYGLGSVLSVLHLAWIYSLYSFECVPTDNCVLSSE